MSKVQIDNSHFALKVALRIHALENCGIKKAKVLDAFGGEGKLWREITKQWPHEIDITAIEFERQKARGLIGDNLKILPALDLKKYDLIDLDAYGVPYGQLKECFRQNYKGVIVITYILTRWRTIKKHMLIDLGYTKQMIEKCPTLFNKEPMEKNGLWLAQKGVKKITGYFLENNFKNYFWFNC